MYLLFQNMAKTFLGTPQGKKHVTWKFCYPGKESFLLETIHFQRRTVSFRGCVKGGLGLRNAKMPSWKRVDEDPKNHHGTQSINGETGTPTTRCVAWKNCPTLGEGKFERPISFRWVIDRTLTSHIKLYHMVMLLSCPECTIWTSKCPIFPDIHFQYLILKDTPLKFNISPLKIGQTCSKRSHSYHSSSDHH